MVDTVADSIYGYTVAVDAFQKIYVIPIDDAFEDMRRIIPASGIEVDIAHSRSHQHLEHQGQSAAVHDDKELGTTYTRSPHPVLSVGEKQITPDKQPLNDEHGNKGRTVRASLAADVDDLDRTRSARGRKVQEGVTGAVSERNQWTLSPPSNQYRRHRINSKGKSQLL